MNCKSVLENQLALLQTMQEIENKNYNINNFIEISRLIITTIDQLIILEKMNK